MEGNCKIVQKTKNYEFIACYTDTQLELKLNVIGDLKNKKFSGHFTDQTLSGEINDKFGGTQNIYSLFDDPKNYTVDPQKGQLNLQLSFSLPNGKKIVHRGVIVLTPITSGYDNSQQNQQLKSKVKKLEYEIQQVKAQHEKQQKIMMIQIKQLQAKVNDISAKTSVQLESCRQMVQISKQMLEASKKNLTDVDRLSKKLQSTNQIKQLEQKIIQLEDKTIDRSDRSLNQISLLKEENKKMVNLLNSIGLKCEIQESKYNKVVEDLEAIRDNDSPKKNVKKFSQVKQNKIKKVVAHHNLAYASQFNILKNRIQFIGPDKSQTQFLFSPQTESYSQLIITMRIIKSSGGAIFIGAIDSNYASEKCIKGNKQPNYIRYQSQYGGLYEGGKLIYEEGQEYGFKKDQDICMIIDVNEGWIQWWVNKQARIKHNAQRLKDHSITWVPHIVFSNHGDTIELIQS